MIDIRDVRIEDAEDIAAILNPIIAARLLTALDTPVTVEQEREFIRKLLLPRHFSCRPRHDIHPHRRLPGRLAVCGFYPCFRSRRRHRHVCRPRSSPAGHRRAGCSPRRSLRRGKRATRSSSPTFALTTTPALQTYLNQGFRVVGTAERHAKIDGKYIDEVLIERAV